MTTKHQPGMRISEYLLEECVGTGTFGEVWRARHHVWEKEHVAVKLPTAPEYVRYLQREGIVIHGLKHANIIRVSGFDPFAETPYLIMEFVAGPSLRHIINQHPKGLPLPVAANILRGLLDGLAAAHANGVLHRDLKPGNILLNLGDRPLAAILPEDVKIGDFGLGVSNEDTLRSIAQSASLARDDQLVGTLAYIAPELRDGHEKASPRSDLYSLGVILFEMLTGERPAGAELPSTLRAEVPAAFDEIFRRTYARYDTRLETAAAVLQLLEERLSPGRGKVPPIPGLKPRISGPACPSCGSIGLPGDQFCTQCGQQLVSQVRRCPACQGYPGPQDRFCIFCGAALPLEV